MVWRIMLAALCFLTMLAAVDYIDHTTFESGTVVSRQTLIILSSARTCFLERAPQ